MVVSRERVLGDGWGSSGFSLMAAMRVRFDDCTFDPETRELFRGGKTVHLHPKAFRLLEILLESRPRALSKAELHEKLWPGSFVSEANLASLAAEIRRGIGEKGRGARKLRTVYGFGYAFSGDAIEDKRIPPPRAARYCLVWERKEMPLTTGENVVGRDRNADVSIDDSTISRRHARIRIAGNGATVEDLGSKNGTFVQGRRIDKPRRLSDGDRIQIGSVVLTFREFSPEKSTDTRR
jgi:DNA-binding winged helix-turn-helix (wHTH) protein